MKNLTLNIALPLPAEPLTSSWARTLVDKITSHLFAIVYALQNNYRDDGANECMGTATLSSGTIVVSNTRVTANSRIFLSRQATGSNIGTPYISARTAGTSFTISSTNGSDNGQIAWQIFEPAT